MVTLTSVFFFQLQHEQHENHAVFQLGKRDARLIGKTNLFLKRILIRDNSTEPSPVIPENF
jgi:hypothetical protein